MHEWAIKLLLEVGELVTALRSGADMDGEKDSHGFKFSYTMAWTMDAIGYPNMEKVRLTN